MKLFLKVSSLFEKTRDQLEVIAGWILTERRGDPDPRTRSSGVGPVLPTFRGEMRPSPDLPKRWKDDWSGSVQMSAGIMMCWTGKTTFLALTLCLVGRMVLTDPMIRIITRDVGQIFVEIDVAASQHYRRSW